MTQSKLEALYCHVTLLLFRLLQLLHLGRLAVRLGLGHDARGRDTAPLRRVACGALVVATRGLSEMLVFGPIGVTYSPFVTLSAPQSTAAVDFCCSVFVADW